VVDHLDDFFGHAQSCMQDALSKNALVEAYDMPMQNKVFSVQLPDTLDTSKPLRVWKIQGFTPIPCGGTHVNRLDEISSLVLIKCQSKKGKTTVP